jgi:hypothetical protein
MSRLGGKAFWGNQQGAVAVLYALALPALVAVAGVGFDYSRLAGMDTELQNAADQAALAGVTQLDGADGACERAASAASSLVLNKSLLSNDGKGLTISVPDESACDTIGVVRFWASVDSNGRGVTAATGDADAKYIEIVLDDRAANYAFTPIAGALVGSLHAAATAGLDSAICKAAVLFMCNMEGDGETFNVSDYIGVGVNVTKEGKNGNWGFVGPGNDNPTLRSTLGLDAPPYVCASVSGGVDVAPGDDANKQVVDAFNTRFDLDNNCPVSGGCSASANSTKDLVATNATSSCPTWQESSNPYAPTSLQPLNGTTRPYPNAMGYPRDICHAVSSTGAGCVGPSSDTAIIGDGIWDVNAYFHVNYGIDDWATDPNLADLERNGKNGLPLRYDVYKWELKHAGETVNGRTVLGDRKVTPPNATPIARGAPKCVSGITPSASAIDRRLISVAVVSKAECAKIKGNSYNPQVQQWVDAFLIEPMADRVNTYKSANGTSSKEIYVEIVRATPAGGQAESPVRRDVPYLVR